MSRSFREPQGLCLISFSKNSDHQNTVFSMFQSLHDSYRVATVAAKNPVSLEPPTTSSNVYVDCPDRPGISKGTFNLASIRRMVKAIRQTGCKIIYFESVHLWNLFVMLALGRDYQYVQTIHDVIPHDGSKSVLLCQKVLCKCADTVVIKSEQFVGDARRIYGLGKDKIKVIGVWRSYPDDEPVPHPGGFLFFGRLRKYKGMDAMERIIRSCPTIKFDIVGESDAATSLAAQEMAQLENVNAVLRSVNDEEMRMVFNRAGWILLPYESASQSGVIIDAYKFGKPVIAFNVGAISSQIINGKTGYLVTPGNIDEFVEAVRMAAELSMDEYASLSSAAYRFGFEHYAAQEICSSLVDHFNVASI